MIKLNEWKGDNLHIDSDIGNIDGHNKTWNFIVTERESGKSTLLLMFRDYLLNNGISENNIIHMNFESGLYDEINDYYGSRESKK